jgi:hypothetical protein
MAISSHSISSVDALAAAGTSSSATANTGSAACTPRPDGPWPPPA